MLKRAFSGVRCNKAWNKNDAEKKIVQKIY